MTDSHDLRRTRALLFDLDGTLLDTVADLAEATNAMLLELGRAPLPVARIATFVGKGADRLVHRALTNDAHGQAANDEFDRARAAFDRHYARENGRQARPYDGVVEGLERFSARGLPMACVTNKPQGFSEQLLAASGLARYFAVVIGGDVLPRRKPDPLPLLEAATRLGQRPEHCLMVGDSANDAAAARAARMPVLLVPYGYNEGEPIGSVESDGIVHSFLDVDRQLG
ncbi:MAG: phosphoglycolate phosphatase [Burkholderiaceae bacterium]